MLGMSACTSYAGAGPGDDDDTPIREHDERFIGLWAVTQPYHALYEQTLYRFESDGRLEVGPSIPADCSGHLSRHCVTGSVANCTPEPPNTGCTSELTCVFGGDWHSLGPSTLVIAGECSDGLRRPIQFELDPDASGNAEFGANATLISVASDPAWSHDNFDWAFQKCPDGDESTCPFGAPL
jgi:hypothetical protein